MAGGPEERSIHEMLKDSPSLNENSSAIHSGSAEPVTPTFGFTTTIGGPPHPPSTLRLQYSVSPQDTTVTSPGETSLNGSIGSTNEFLKNGVSKIDSLKHWSISTYKCTRQIMLEKLGKTTRTVDTELEGSIEQLRDTQRKYLSILRLTRAMSTHFFNMVQTQHSLAETFSDLAQKSPELQEEFLYNAETQRNLTKNGEILLNALNFFCSSVNTLCNQTMDDTLSTIRQYELARVEFDAYKMDLDNAGSQAATPTSPMAEEAQRNFIKHKENYEKLREACATKMQFLDDNRVKVMHKQLLLLHNATAAYFSGNATALESTLKQFNIKIKSPNSVSGSWLEQ